MVSVAIMFVPPTLLQGATEPSTGTIRMRSFIYIYTYTHTHIYIYIYIYIRRFYRRQWCCSAVDGESPWLPEVPSWFILLHIEKSAEFRPSSVSPRFAYISSACVLKRSSIEA